jgi:uncharacterized phage-like protein YoqJ
MKQLIEKITNAIRQAFEKSDAKWKQQQQQQLQDRILQLMYAMTLDLYAAFENHAYSGLNQITNPTCIRVHNYKITETGILYQFKLSKKTPDKIAFVLLAQMRSNMNTDIAAVQQHLLHQYGQQYLYYMNPFLYSGIYVMSVQDFAGGDVIITVATHVSP